MSPILPMGNPEVLTLSFILWLQLQRKIAITIIGGLKVNPRVFIQLHSPNMPGQNLIQVGEESVDQIARDLKSRTLGMLQQWSIEKSIKHLQGSHMAPLRVKEFCNCTASSKDVLHKFSPQGPFPPFIVPLCSLFYLAWPSSSSDILCNKRPN